MFKQFKVLVVDDEPAIVKLLTRMLEKEGFSVESKIESANVLEFIHLTNPDLLILDVMMPGIDGYELCRRIRQEHNVPIIFLSAKNETVDKILALTLGADDYLTKPFDSTELILRIKAVLRRTQEQSETKKRQIINYQDLSIDASARIVKIKDKVIELTPKEFGLLWTLASRPEQVFTREQLLYQVWETEFVEDTAIVSTLVRRLREKIEPTPNSPCYIKTIRSVGYKFGS